MVAIASAIAGLFHDFGKINPFFAAKLKNALKNKKPVADPFRHEWISLRLFEAFVHSCGDTDKDWISQLTSISGKRHDFSWFENVIKDEIDKTSSVIFEVTGRYPKLLRPSYGVYNNIVKKIGNMPIIIWDIDTLDWKYHNSKRIASRVINKVKDGDIILMHDIYSATANSLNIIIPELQNRGYTFVTIPELFYYKEITLEKGMVYGYAR